MRFGLDYHEFQPAPAGHQSSCEDLGAEDRKWEWNIMEKNPPIPQNTDRFALIGGVMSWCVRIDENGFVVWKGLNNLNSMERRDCVANARCMWLDMAVYMPIDNEAKSECLANAEAWRKWGRGEAWE